MAKIVDLDSRRRRGRTTEPPCHHDVGWVEIFFQSIDDALPEDNVLVCPCARSTPGTIGSGLMHCQHCLEPNISLLKVASAHIGKRNLRDFLLAALEKAGV